MRRACGARTAGRPRPAGEPVDGRGELWSWTVTHAPFDGGWAQETPCITAVVELGGGVRFLGALEGCAPDEARIGLPVVAELQPHGDCFVFVTFVPDRG
ncbi:OB-fold domain-containing protein [Baekduia soli]|uniref:OB-fold domain-containing protein n=1 Tax=Baekduia soli TaxID=496014 RepID=A0A5B8UCN0_9ACTN|nr:OB-fold domain-containing protein [Baekduia soli]